MACVCVVCIYLLVYMAVLQAVEYIEVPTLYSSIYTAQYKGDMKFKGIKLTHHQQHYRNPRLLPAPYRNSWSSQHNGRNTAYNTIACNVLCIFYDEKSNINVNVNKIFTETHKVLRRLYYNSKQSTGCARETIFNVLEKSFIKNIPIFSNSLLAHIQNKFVYITRIPKSLHNFLFGKTHNATRKQNKNEENICPKICAPKSDPKQSKYRICMHIASALANLCATLFECHGYNRVNCRFQT